MSHYPRLILKHLFVCTLTILSFGPTKAQTPLAINGQLKLVGNQLSNECGAPVQLRGISSHGPQWFENCYTAASLTAMRDDWGADVFRVAMYTESGGYLSNPNYWAAWVNDAVDFCEDLGIYSIIDWHILSDNDPWKNMDQAKAFWAFMAESNAGRKNVLYEICNEPNGGSVNWARVKSYAEEIIPIIRAHDPENIIIVGTPQWSQKIDDAAANPLTGDNAYNVMYTFHFYAGTHSYLQNTLRYTLSEIPIFCTEWGTPEASGDGGVNSSVTQGFMDIFNGDNPDGITVSWCNWSFADKDETSAMLNPGSCSSGNWSSRTTSGNIVYDHMNNPADNFQACSDNSISEGRQLEEIYIYPNPVQDMVSLPGFNGSYELQNITGKVIQKGMVSEQSSIDLSGMPSGIYFIKTPTSVNRIVVK